MLRNLKAIYLRSQDLNNALVIMNWIVAAAPHHDTEVRDRGMVYQQLECFRPAMADFERYLELAPDCGDGDSIRSRVMELQSSISMLN